MLTPSSEKLLKLIQNAGTDWTGLKITINDTHREDCILLNSIQEFIETKAWVLLTFLLSLHNQLISITFYYHILKCTDV